jgi:hypothetical protein
MPRKGPGTKLGKLPFHGPRRHCSWTLRVWEGDRGRQS